MDSLGFEWNGSDHHLVVQCCKCCSNEWSYPEDPMVIPGMVLVEDDGRTKTPSWVDTGAGYGNSCQVYQENGEPNWQRCQYRDVGISGTALGISGREDGVNKHKGTNDLRT